MTYKPVDTAITIMVGPCIDDTDFKSLEEAIAYNAAGMDISLIVEKTDGTTAVTAITPTTGGTSDWTHKDGGYYEVEITAAQNAEEGIAYLRGVCTGVLPFESAHYDIVPTHIYDSWIKGSDKLEVDAVQLSNSAQSLLDLKDFADAGYDPATNKVQGVVLVDTTTTNTDMVGTANAALAATALTNATWTDAKAGALTDWVNGGRLDLILDIIAADTTTDIPAKILKYTQLLARSDAAIATDNATELTAINADGGSGAGDFSNQTEATEAIRDRGDAAWTTGGGSAPTVGEIRAEMEGAGYKLALIEADTNDLQGNQGAWATATAIALSAQGKLDVNTECDTALSDYGANTTVPDAAGVAPTAAEIKTEIEQAGSSIATILVDTATDIPTQIAALHDITVADIIAGISDGTLDLQEMMRIILAATAGKSSGGGTVTLVFRDAADSKARITATVDANGNRTAMTLDGA